MLIAIMTYQNQVRLQNNDYRSWSWWRWINERNSTTAPALLNEASRGRGQYWEITVKHHISDPTIYSTWPEHVNQTSGTEDTKQTSMQSDEDKNATWSKDQTVRKRPYTSEVHLSGGLRVIFRVEDKQNDLWNVLQNQLQTNQTKD